MKFEQLALANLKILKSKGFNILTSNNKLTDDHILWFPESVADVCDYLITLDTKGTTPFQEPNILVIDDAISNIEDENLIGEVLIPFKLM